MNFIYNKTKNKLIVAGFAVLLASVPIYALAAPFLGPLVPDCSMTGANNTLVQPCGFNDLGKLGANLLAFAVTIAVPIAAVAFAYAGFLYLTAGGNSGQISKASGIFLNVGIGFIIVLAAWLIVNFVLNELVTADSYINLLKSAP